MKLTILILFFSLNLQAQTLDDTIICNAINNSTEQLLDTSKNGYLILYVGEGSTFTDCENILYSGTGDIVQVYYVLKLYRIPTWEIIYRSGVKYMTFPTEKQGKMLIFTSKQLDFDI